MYHYNFRMVDLLIRVDSPFELHEFYEMTNYCVPETTDEPVAIYEIQFLPTDHTIQGELISNERKSAIYDCGDRYDRYYFWRIHTEDQFILLSHRKDDLRNYTIYVQQEHLADLLREFHLSPFLSMEQMLLEHDIFQLHSSVIDWKGGGILFTAPSGTGKSTQAELWRKHEDVRIINGDKAMICKKDGSYRAYGSPYAGTSGIYTDLSVPIRAIVVLSQAPENRIERLGGAAAFRKLYRESTIPSWNQTFVEKISGILLDLMAHVPVYHLACRPDQEAVEVLKAELLK